MVINFLEVSALGVRLFAIWLALQSFSFFTTAHGMSSLIPDAAAALRIGFIIGAVGLLVSAFIWFFPLAVARFLIPKIADAQPAISHSELWRMGCVFIGIFVLSTTIPYLMTEAFLFISGGYASGTYQQIETYRLAEYLFRTLFAVALIVGNKALYKYAIR